MGTTLPKPHLRTGLETSTAASLSAGWGLRTTAPLPLCFLSPEKTSITSIAAS